MAKRRPGRPPSEQKWERVYTSLPGSEVLELREVAQRELRPVSNLIRVAVRDYLARRRELRAAEARAPYRSEAD